jgi:nicotinamidase-related amidase
LEVASGDLIASIRPSPADRFVVKPRYSAFDHTPLELILESLGCERLIIAGMSTEGCVTQSAIAARERGLKVTLERRACATIDEELEATAVRCLVDVAGVLVA